MMRVMKVRIEIIIESSVKTGAIIMNTCVQTSPEGRNTIQASLPLHTTLYDLIAAVSEAVRPDEENAVTATMIHILRTYRVTCLDDFEGCRLVCEGEPSYSAVA
jgi:hypothetical protein